MTGLFGRIPLRRQPRAESLVADELPVRAIASRPDGSVTVLYEGLIVDLNGDGASLTCNKVIDKGWHVRMTLPLPKPVLVTGRILHRRKRAGQNGTVYVHGVEFDRADTGVLEAIRAYCVQRTVNREQQTTQAGQTSESTKGSGDASAELFPQASSAKSGMDTNAGDSVFLGAPQAFLNQGDHFMDKLIAPLQTDRPLAQTLLSVLGAAARIDGKFQIAESIEIQCEVSGELVVGGTFVIGEFGRVTADVSTVNAVVRGSYSGNLKASGSVEIAAGARVTGSLESNELTIGKGAIFTGSVKHVEKDSKGQLGDAVALVVTDVEKPIPVSQLIALDVAGSVGRGDAQEQVRPRGVELS